MDDKDDTDVESDMVSMSGFMKAGTSSKDLGEGMLRRTMPNIVLAHFEPLERPAFRGVQWDVCCWLRCCGVLSGFLWGCGLVIASAAGWLL
ncbi:hypothetical protein Patl1_34300 [Pistacia atlantica]|uniref:Uncharacterized protein n=1 Tax=Pistacia atlantica TaxID=434234 RepID=A0ACC0ZTT7_9ROSI|nr:hypothetical protein Patl1_34300 [Pistacia atlantica]